MTGLQFEIGYNFADGTASQFTVVQQSGADVLVERSDGERFTVDAEWIPEVIEIAGATLTSHTPPSDTIVSELPAKPAARRSAFKIPTGA